MDQGSENMINLKLRYIWFKQDLQRLYYRVFHNIISKDFNSLLPTLGRGKFVDVIRRGSLIDIISHSDCPDTKQGTIRIIPCQYNHGVMIEFINQQGQMEWRTHMDYRSLYLRGSGAQESFPPNLKE